MKRAVLVLVFVFVIATGTTTWSQCPEYDSGECDSLLIELYGDVENLENPPIFAKVQILVSHDIVDPVLDSIGGFIVPLCYTFSGPASYCSTSTYWNELSLNPYNPAMARSVFRDLPDNDNPVIYNRMFSMDRDFSNRGWDFIQLTLDGISHYWLTLVPTGTPDQRWWEGDRVLLATMTFKADTATTICIDTCFWPPSSRVQYSNSNAQSYIPRHKLPVCILCGTEDVRELEGSEDSRPSEFRLAQNYPNPFNPATNIEFSLVKAAHVQIEIFNIVGQKVKTLVDEEMKAGNYVADWDGTDQGGDPISSGIYFYRMKADEFSDMKKMLLVK